MLPRRPRRRLAAVGAAGHDRRGRRGMCDCRAAHARRHMALQCPL